MKTTPIIIRNEIFSDFLLQRYFITLENKLADCNFLKKLFDRSESIQSRNFVICNAETWL